MSNAFATYTTKNTTSNGRACLQGIVEVETSKGDWFAFSVFGFTPAQIQNHAYMEADFHCRHKGLALQSLRAA
jgi:hypothetical protein